MHADYFLDRVPTVLFFVAFVLIALLPIEAGQRLGAKHRIPFTVWLVLTVVTIIAMLGAGFQFGLAGNWSLLVNLMLSMTFALVMRLPFNLDQPGKGLIGVSQQPMYDLNERLRAQE